MLIDIQSPEKSLLPRRLSDCSLPPSISQDDDSTSLDSRSVSPQPLDSQDESLQPLLPYEGPPVGFSYFSICPTNTGGVNGQHLRLSLKVKLVIFLCNHSAMPTECSCMYSRLTYRLPKSFGAKISRVHLQTEKLSLRTSYKRSAFECKDNNK